MSRTVAFQVRENPIYCREKPIRNERYLAFIRRQASVVSGLGPCDACHTGPHGANQKTSDLSAIPLTRREHAAFDADPRGFAQLHGLDIPDLIEGYNAVYIALQLLKEDIQ